MPTPVSKSNLRENINRMKRRQEEIKLKIGERSRLEELFSLHLIELDTTPVSPSSRIVLTTGSHQMLHSTNSPAALN